MRAIMRETYGTIEAVGSRFMARNRAAVLPEVTTVAAYPTFKVALPYPVAGLVEDRGRDGAIREQGQVWPGAEVVYSNEPFHG
jgi:hypothetical protein